MWALDRKHNNARFLLSASKAPTNLPGRKTTISGLKSDQINRPIKKGQSINYHSGHIDLDNRHCISTTTPPGRPIRTTQSSHSQAHSPITWHHKTSRHLRGRFGGFRGHRGRIGCPSAAPRSPSRLAALPHHQTSPESRQVCRASTDKAGLS